MDDAHLVPEHLMYQALSLFPRRLVLAGCHAGKINKIVTDGKLQERL
jgi:hypothetical protein